MKYIDTDELISYLSKIKEPYKSQMVDRTKSPIDHLETDRGTRL